MNSLWIATLTADIKYSLPVKSMCGSAWVMSATYEQAYDLAVQLALEKYPETNYTNHQALVHLVPTWVIADIYEQADFQLTEQDEMERLFGFGTTAPKKRFCE